MKITFDPHPNHYLPGSVYDRLLAELATFRATLGHPPHGDPET